MHYEANINNRGNTGHRPAPVGVNFYSCISICRDTYRLATRNCKIVNKNVKNCFFKNEFYILILLEDISKQKVIKVLLGNIIKIIKKPNANNIIVDLY